MPLFSGKTFMEVEQTKALTGLGLLGNSGGYLGMFLGYAMIQLPDLVSLLYNWLDRIVSNMA